MHVPGFLSDTGKLRRRFFPTRDAAKKEAQRLREVADGKQIQAAAIDHWLAKDAINAAEILKPYGVTLAQCARFYAAHHDTRSKVPTMAEAWAKSIEKRPNHRGRTLADYRAWERALPGWFLAKNAFDVDAAAIEKALNETTKGRTRWATGLRYISAVLSDLVKIGKLKENAAKGVHIERKPETNEEVSIYTPEELRKLLGACRDYVEGLDKKCASCAPAFALMAFAGIRPDEVAKLRWSDVSLELANIRIGPAVAKKNRRRNVRVHPTLAVWLQTVPASNRHGKIVPPRWRHKATRVRKEAGIDGHEKQDALRHSFGTYLLATENDLAKLQSDMGHEHVRVFFDFYHKALTAREALPYWEILPPADSSN